MNIKNLANKLRDTKSDIREIYANGAHSGLYDVTPEADPLDPDHLYQIQLALSRLEDIARFVSATTEGIGALLRIAGGSEREDQTAQTARLNSAGHMLRVAERGIDTAREEIQAANAMIAEVRADLELADHQEDER